MKEKYQESQKIKILLVPGHDEGSGGTSFKKIREAEINLELSENLFSYLSGNPLFEVESYRDRLGYNKKISEYIANNSESIANFVGAKKYLINSLVSSGDISILEGVMHNNAPEETVKNLYSINKWANDNEIDLVIHIHFNDYPGRNFNQEGNYSGFAIYVPEKQFSNAKASKELAGYIFRNLDFFILRVICRKRVVG